MSKKQSKIQDFEIKERFSSLFTKKDEVVEAIKKSMGKDGYDPTQPLILAVGPWTEKPVLIDGYTRYQVATGLNIDDIPRVSKSFDTEDDAFIYAVHLQKDRRNLSDAELYKLVELIDKTKARGGSRNPHGRSGKSKMQRCTFDKTDHNNEKSSQASANNLGTTPSTVETTPKSRSSAETAKELGVSQRQVSKVRAVMSSGYEDIKESVKNSGMSINRAEKEVQERKKQKKKSVAKLKMVSGIGYFWEWNPVNVGHDSKLILDEGMLLAPVNDSPQNEREHNVKVSPKLDLFHSKVPTDWIDKILDVCRDTPQWNYLFATRNPERLSSVKFPQNSWVGVTVDTRESAELALQYLSTIDVPKKFLEIVGIENEDGFEEIQNFGIEDFSGVDWVIFKNKYYDFNVEDEEFLNILSMTEAAIRSKCKISWTNAIKIGSSPMDDLS